MSVTIATLCNLSNSLYWDCEPVDWNESAEHIHLTNRNTQTTFSLAKNKQPEANNENSFAFYCEELLQIIWLDFFVETPLIL